MSVNGCDHGDLTGSWPGFEPAVKDLRTHRGACDECADARCPVGHAMKLMAYRARWADLVARYGYDGLASANDNPHGVDLRRPSPFGNVVWVWEFARDDPRAIEQAVVNLHHILEVLRADGVAAEPGPAFDDEQWRGYFGPSGAVTRVRSAPSAPGIEVFQVFECSPCMLAEDWLYCGLTLRMQRQEDLCEVDLGAALAHKHGYAVEPAFRRRTDGSVQAQVSLRPGLSAEQRGAAMHAWFRGALALLDPWEVDALLNVPVTGESPQGVLRLPGARAATVAAGDEIRYGQLLTASSWAEFVRSLTSAPARARLWCGQVNEYGWVNEAGERPTFSVAAGLSATGTLLLDMVFDRDPRPGTLEMLRSFADRFDVAHGEIGDRPYSARITHQTLLERLLYRTPGEGRGLRGYGWLTICGPDVTGRPGDVEELTDGFAEAERLPNGAYWLLATERYGDYTEERAERLWLRLGPALPQERPARSAEEPHLIVLACPRTTHRPRTTG